MSWEAAGTYPVSPQSSCVGSFAVVELDGRFDSDAGLTVGVNLWTTVAGDAATQTLAELEAGGKGLIIEMSERKIALSVDGEVVATTEPLVPIAAGPP